MGGLYGSGGLGNLDDVDLGTAPTDTQHLIFDSASAKWKPGSDGGGDMLVATYDPGGVDGDAFDMDNMVEGTSLILTAAERLKIAVVGENFLSAYDTTTQSVSVADTYQDLTFNTNGTLNGWTHVTGTNVFGCNATGTYMCCVNWTAQKTAGGSGEFGVRALFNSVELAGAAGGSDLALTNSSQRQSGIFIFAGTTAQNLEIEFWGNVTTNDLVPHPASPGATVETSAQIFIMRIA